MTEDSESTPSARGGAVPNQASGRRRGHVDMGVATSDADYLSSGGTVGHPFRGDITRGASRPKPKGQPDFSHLLESPTTGKPIFIAQRRRRARHGRIAAGVALAIAAIIFIWYALAH